MNRRKVLLGSGVALSTALAGCTGGSDENGGDNGDENGSDNGEDNENTEAEITGVYNYRKYDRLTTPDSDDVYYESDGETQYVGAQVQLTNNTDGELSLKGFELSILAGSDGEDVSIHGNSNTDPLEAIGAGETVETWMFFTAPPGTEITGFGATQWAEHTFELTHDPDLELALEEYNG